MEIRIPRWMQMVSLPVIAILVWFAASLFSQALFIFATALVLALILDPLVRRLEWLHIPRFLAVFIVFLSFLALIVLFVILVIPPASNQVQELIDNFPSYTDTIRDQINSWKAQIERLNLPIDVTGETDRVISRIQESILDFGSRVVELSINVVGLVTQLFLIIIISIYMLLDSKRIGRTVRSLFPGDRQADADEFILRTRRAVAHWVQAQTLLSLLIGVSTGIGIWALGILGIWSEGSQYVLFFGAWAALTEFIPYVGPVLGAIPAVVAASFVSPWAALAVILVFLFIQQVEGHILVPNIMGQVVGIHPLVVIFAVLAGAELKGIAGMLLTLPLLALAREIVVFFKSRIRFEKFVDARTPLDAGPGEYDETPPPKAITSQKEIDGERVRKKRRDKKGEPGDSH